MAAETPNTTVIACLGGCGRTMTITLSNGTVMASTGWTCEDCTHVKLMAERRERIIRGEDL